MSHDQQQHFSSKTKIENLSKYAEDQIEKLKSYLIFVRGTKGDACVKHLSGKKNELNAKLFFRYFGV